MPAPAPKLRLFFAVWPPRETAAALYEWALRAQRAAGGRVTRQDLIHLTLAFLGAQTHERAQDALAVARRMRFGRHRLALEQVVYWRRNRIVWAGPHHVPEALAVLAAELRTGLGDAGFVLEKRAFAVHVTLLRKAGGGELPPLPTLEWPVTEFVLVRSELSTEGSRYEFLERFRCAD